MSLSLRLIVRADFLIVLVPGYFKNKLVSRKGIVNYFYTVEVQVLSPMINNYPNTCTLSQHPEVHGEVVPATQSWPIRESRKIAAFN